MEMLHSLLCKQCTRKSIQLYTRDIQPIIWCLLYGRQRNPHIQSKVIVFCIISRIFSLTYVCDPESHIENENGYVSDAVGFGSVGLVCSLDRNGRYIKK